MGTLHLLGISFLLPRFLWYQGLNTGPCTCEAGGDTTELKSQPLAQYFCKYSNYYSKL